MYTESKNPYNNSLSVEDVEKKIHTNEPICVKVLSLKKDEKSLFCEISKFIYGILPIDEFEINLKKIKNHNNENVYPQIERVMHSTITVCVTKKLDSPNVFLLSRKTNLKRVYNELKEKEYIPCEITGINEYFWYVDCGQGVSGRISIPYIPKKDAFANKTNFNVGDIITAKISSFDDSMCRFKLSYVSESNIVKQENLHKLYDIVDVTVINRLKSNDPTKEVDFFVKTIDSNEFAILDVSPKDNVNIGDKVQCFIYGQKNDGKFKLSLIKKL